MKTIVLGLDGATWEVLLPLMEMGKMPHLKRLRDACTRGVLKSTVPPITGSAWVSLASGMTPDQTGIIDFRNRKDETFRLEGISSSDYKNRAFWEYFIDEGKRVGLIGFPMAFPPYEMNGFMVSGVGATDEHGICFPEELKNEIEEHLGGPYEIYVPYHQKKYNDMDLFLTDIHRVLDKKIKTIQYLFETKDVDLFCAVLSETDWIQHRMWHYWDESHPRYTEGYKNAFIGFWKKIDSLIGYMSANIDKQDNLFIVSDHGFGGNTKTLYINSWLRKERMLNLKHRNIYIREKLYAVLKKIKDTVKINRYFPNLYDKVKSPFKKLKKDIADQIDLNKTNAFDPGYSIPFAGIHILGSPECDKKSIERKIEEKLKEFSAKNNIHLAIKKYNTEMLPDMIIHFQNWEGVFVKKPDRHRQLIEHTCYSDRHTGSHRREGIYLGCSSLFQQKECDLDIYDVAGVILYAHSLQVPETIYHENLNKVIKKDIFDRNPCTLREPLHVEDTPEGGIGEDTLSKKLQDLGYM